MEVTFETIAVDLVNVRIDNIQVGVVKQRASGSWEPDTRLAEWIRRTGQPATLYRTLNDAWGALRKCAGKED